MDDIMHYVHDWNLADNSELLKNKWSSKFSVTLQLIYFTAAIQQQEYESNKYL